MNRHSMSYQNIAKKANDLRRVQYKMAISHLENLIHQLIVQKPEPKTLKKLLS